MKIAIRGTARRPGLMGGAALCCVYLAEALSKIVDRVDVYCPDPESFPHCNAIKVNPIYAASRSRRVFRFLNRLARPDNILSQYDAIIFPTQLEPLARAPNAKRVIMAHDVIPLLFPREYPKLYLYYKFYFEHVLREMDKIVAPSESTKNDLLHYYRLPMHQVQVIRLGFNRQLVGSETGPALGQLSLRETLGDCLLYIGGHLPHKNLHRLIQALSLVKSHFDVSLVMAGLTDDRYTGSLRETARRCGVQNSVRILGMLSNSHLADLLRSARALVVPSLYEGFGMTPLEGMAAGVPVAASRCPAVLEACGQAAVYFDPWVVEDMARALEEVLADQEIRARCIQAGYERVRQFDWDLAAREYVDMIGTL